MKKVFLIMALVSLTTVAIFNSCSKDGKENENENGGNTSIGNTVTAVVEDGSSYNETIDNVKVVIEAANNYEVTSASYSDGGFVLELPASVSDQYLESIESSFDNDIPAGITISNSGVKTATAYILAYKADKSTGTFYCGASGWTGFLLYADADVSITGTYTDEYGVGHNINNHLIKGWNIVYVKSTNEATGMYYYETTQAPSGARWYFVADNTTTGNNNNNITVVLENGSSYNEIIDNVKVVIEAANNNEVTSAPYSDGGFVLELPASVSDYYLTNIESSFDNSITISNSGAKTVTADIRAYKNDKLTGTFYYGTTLNYGISDWASFLLYVNEDVTITGSYTNEVGFVQDINLHLTKGWNIVYIKITFDNNGVHIYETTQSPSGARWYFVPGAEEEVPYSKSDECDIVGFTVNNVEWIIDGTDITYTCQSGMEEPSLTPTITLSPGATVYPSDNVAQNFFSAEGVTYIVTAEDGVTQKIYTAKAIIENATSGASGITGDCTWEVTGESGDYTLTISGNGAMGDYTGFIKAPWSDYNDEITTLIIQSGVTHIGDYAFNSCQGLTGNLIIPNSVTSIGENAFYSCGGFTGELIIPNSVESISHSAFAYCDGFTGELTIGNSVTSIGEFAFYNCNYLTGSLTIPNSVKSIGDYAFYSCNLTGDLTIGNSVTFIGDNAFSFCNLTGDLIIPNSVESIGKSAFYSCNRFTGKLIISNSVKSIGDNTFYNCTGLTGELIIPNSVESIDQQAFYNCYKLTSVTIPSSVTSIGEKAFWNCTRLTSIINHSLVPQNINNVFNADRSVCVLKVPTGSISAYQAAPGWNEFENIEGI
jgi:hypothetical protein